MQLLSFYLRRETKKLHENGIKVVHLGDLSALHPRLQRQVNQAIELTRNNTRMTLALAWNYGGRADIVEAVRRITADGVRPEDIDESTISSRLATADLPDPDLIIRTAGEMRISNFLLWQVAYAEFSFIPAYWPDFGTNNIDEALITYSQRTRRFGGVPNEERDSETASADDKNGAGLDTSG
jgi:undecaprenyl diphosphate synthase